MKIQAFHKYNRLVDEGKVKALACGICGEPFIMRSTLDGDPLLGCMNCERIIQPGLALYEQVLAVVKEHSE